MKYIVPESNLKKLLRNSFNVDLTDKITMVTNKWELPLEFDRLFTERTLNHYLNKFGPMYVFNVKRLSFIVQERDGKWNIVDFMDRMISESEFMRIIGIEALGLSVGDLINMYFVEETP